MAAGNYTTFRPKDVDCIKFGSIAWSSSDISSTASSLDMTFAANNTTILFNAVGTRDANNPVKSEAFAKDITYSGNERTVSEDNLLGADSNGTQNQELEIKPTSLLSVTMTLVYRNNVPFSLFNDTTDSCLMSMDNSEGTATGIANFGFNDIIVNHVGTITRNAEGNMTQQLKFTCKGGTTGSEISVTDSCTVYTWSRIVGGSYAEEVRLT